MFLVLIIVTIVAVAVVVSVFLNRADAFRPIVVDAATARVLSRAGAATRWRAVATLGSAIGVLVAGAKWNEAAPQWYGLPLLLAPGTAACIGLLVFAAFPPLRLEGQTGRRVASLAPRYPWSLGPRWAYLLPLGSAIAVIVFAILAGLASSPSDDGNYRSISFDFGSSSSSAGPYPGWYYGIPLIIMTVVLFATTVLALWRVSGAPRPAVEALRAPDSALRLLAARTVMRLSSGALFVYAGGVLSFAGLTTGNAARILTAEGQITLQPAGALGVVELVAGVLAVLLGASLLALSVVDASRPLFARDGRPLAPVRQP